MSDHPAEAWGEYRAAPAGVLALFILAGVSCWLGWYAYRGELGRLVSATPEIEVDIQPPKLPSIPSPAPLAETTPSVVINLTASPPASASASLAAPAVSGSTGIPQAQPLEIQPPESQAVEVQPLAPASPLPATITASAAPVEATTIRLPRAVADLTIDDTPDRVAVDAQLAELEHRARITGLANGYPVTIERLVEWSRSLPERNFALAPISAIADRQADR